MTHVLAVHARAWVGRPRFSPSFPSPSGGMTSFLSKEILTHTTKILAKRELAMWLFLCELHINPNKVSYQHAPNLDQPTHLV